MAILPMVSAEVYQQDEIIDLKIPCFNNDYSSCDSSTNCTITILYPNATIFVYQNMTYNTNYYNYTIQDGLSALGTYTGTMMCDGADEDGFYNFEFIITPNGEILTEGKAIFYIGLLIILLFFMILCAYSFAKFDNILNRVGMIGLGYLLLISITFIGWNMASDFLTSSPFLIEMLNLIFIVLMIGLFPLLIGGFAWYFLMLWKIKEIEDLMTHGLSEDEAQQRSGKKFKDKRR